jgi:hypothetical protein
MIHRLLPLAVVSLSLGCSAPPSDDAAASSDDALSAIGPARTGPPTRLPIVLVRGFRASPQKNGFVTVAAALRADGHEVVEVTLPPHDSSEVRARTLAHELDPVVLADRPEIGAGGESGTHRDSGFDHVRFYRDLAFELAAKGF